MQYGERLFRLCPYGIRGPSPLSQGSRLWGYNEYLPEKMPHKNRVQFGYGARSPRSQYHPARPISRRQSLRKSEATQFLWMVPILYALCVLLLHRPTHLWTLDAFQIPQSAGESDLTCL